VSLAAVGRRAAERLLHDQEAMARAVTARLYAAHPELLDRHGERGRAKCLQDMRYNIEHLVPAVDLEDAALFAAYVRWLTDMLASRGVASRDVTRCLELLAEETRERLDADEARLVGEIIDAGLAAVEPRG
jgi:hypothetical protein